MAPQAGSLQGLARMISAPPSRLLQGLYLLVVTGILFAAFAGWAYDDPFITYRYARNLANGVGYVYNPGERVQSTTTPLFTLLLATFHRLGLDLPRTANLVGALSLAAGGLLLWDVARTWRAPLAGWAGLVLFPTTPLLVSTLGSETLLYLAFCLGAFALYARGKLRGAALLAALATLARPDGVLVAALLGADYLRRERRLPPWQVGAFFLAPLVAWGSFAWAYFGSPLPVTLSAKQGQGTMAISTGFAAGFGAIARAYLARPDHLLEAFLMALGLSLVLRRPSGWRLFLAWPLLYFAAYSALGVTSYFWYYAPLFPGFLIAAGLGLQALYAWKALPRGVTLWGLGLALTLLAGLQVRDLEVLRQQPDARFPIYRAAGEWLRHNTSPQASVGTLEVGIIGYYAPNPMVDFTGLIQPRVAERFGSQTTYEDAALWAVEQFQPAYLVLHAGLMPRLETGYVGTHCTPAQRLSGADHGYDRDLVIYDCR